MTDGYPYLKIEQMASALQPAGLRAARGLDIHGRRRLRGTDVHILAACEFYDAVAADKEIEVTCSGSASLSADPVLFRRAVCNLLSNVLKCTPGAGRIRIAVEGSDAAGVQVRVSDTGCGFSAEHLPRIFDRFDRVDPARSRDPEGTGLGPAIVKSVVELHGDRATVRSEPGRGTTVILAFPPAA